MPRTKLICHECKKEIPAKEVKERQAFALPVNVPGYNTANGLPINLTWYFCVTCTGKRGVVFK